MKSERKINKIMLISPRYTLYKKDVRRCIPPLGLACLAAFLEQNGYELRILDVANEGYSNVKEKGDFVTYGLSDEEIKAKILEFGPQIIGVSGIFSTQSKNMDEIFKLIKKIDTNIITIAGGSHPTYTIQEMLNNENIDYTIMGESELPMLQFLNTLNYGDDLTKIGGIAFRKEGKDFINNELQYIEDINVLPFPARHLLNMETYFRINLPQNPYPEGKRVSQVITSRGCSAKCIFCTTTNFWGNRYRGRTADNVLAEIRMLKDKYNIDEIQFTDDNLTLNKRRAITILEGLVEMGLKWCLPQGVAVWALDDELLEKMKESGCHQLTFAIESGNQEVLSKIIQKPLILSKVKPLVDKAHQLGIKLHAFCICGVPGETIENMYESYNFVNECGFESASFFAATPCVGSRLLTVCKENNYLVNDFKPDAVFYKIGNITTPEFTAEQVQNLVEEFNKEYNQKDRRTKNFEENKW